MKTLAFVLLTTVAYLLAAIVFGTLLWLVWNITLPDLGIPKISIFQGWGMILIARFLIDGKIAVNINSETKYKSWY